MTSAVTRAVLTETLIKTSNCFGWLALLINSLQEKLKYTEAVEESAVLHHFYQSEHFRKQLQRN